ncbi:phosphoserine phosphatase [Thermococcus cleftensis]|uniref:phosphoserine phosphatase n=1 Tax=Thermococcus cleftensis (strain DSM 27260 / KACC 17922 / CL1) TaxID=163003 RepID=I3ZVJ3_THECF|nr:HAD-IB family phosphatase [Thermococcus cleftensis]AFL95727.1 phosphoserine phosphatase [Thermococcus cleftensis]
MVRLIAFDLEGTLVKSISGWVELHKRFGTWEKGKEYAELFFSGKIDYAEWAELDASLWRGHTKEEIMEWVRSVEYMEGAGELIDFLRRNDFRIAILSSGLLCLARKVGEELGVDYVFANELIFDENGSITGKVNPIVDFRSKGAILRGLKEELKPELTVAVGDGYNDLSMFREADVAIAINPHEGVEGDHVVESLHEVREIIEGLIGGQ